MSCPNCNESMKGAYIDSQFVNHCSSCGCTFFEENSINRITYDSARSLSDDRYRHFITSQEKNCPLDFTPLTAVSNTEAIPSNVTLFVCSSCSGVLAYPEDLIKFKKAQGAKIEYYKTWAKPFASLRTILIVFFISVLGFSSYLVINTLQNRASYRSQAQDVFKTLSVIKSGHYILIGFRTNTPFKSEIILINDKDKKEITRTISSTPKKVHEIILTEVDNPDDYSYRIILTDASGTSIETDLKKLVTAIK